MQTSALGRVIAQRQSQSPSATPAASSGSAPPSHVVSKIFTSGAADLLGGVDELAAILRELRIRASSCRVIAIELARHAISIPRFEQRPNLLRIRSGRCSPPSGSTRSETRGSRRLRSRIPWPEWRWFQNPTLGSNGAEGEVHRSRHSKGDSPSRQKMGHAAGYASWVSHTRPTELKVTNAEVRATNLELHSIQSSSSSSVESRSPGKQLEATLLRLSSLSFPFARRD